MTRTTRTIVLLSAFAALVALVFVLRSSAARAKGGGAPTASASGASSGGDRVVPVATAKVQKRDVPVILEGLGTVTPLASVTVKSQVDGRLDQVVFKEGQPVKRGDVLAIVDPRPFTIQLHQAEAAAARDDATLKNGQLNLERYEALRKDNLIPQQQVDDQRALVGQLEGSMRANRAAIESARLMLDYARITSPIDGVTGNRQVDPGNLVHVSDTNGIVVVTQLDPIGVVFTLPQDDLGRVQRAMHEGKVTVEAYARDGIQKLGAGELLLVDNQVNAQTATIRLKAVVPNAERALWPNAFVKARMHLTTLAGVLVVPASVVQRGPNGTFAYVVGPGDTVQPKPIEVASLQGDLAILAKGVAENEVVVTDGQNQLRPGSRVSPRPGAGTGKTPPAASGGAPASSGSARPSP